MSNKWFDLFDRLYFVLNIQDHFGYIIKKLEIVTNNLPITIFVNKTKNRMTFKTKTGHYLNLLILGMMKLPGGTKSKITKHENSENVTHLEINEVLLLNCNNVNNDCQQDSRVLHTFACNKSFGQLLDFSPKIFIFFKNF